MGLLISGRACYSEESLPLRFGGLILGRPHFRNETVILNESLVAIFFLFLSQIC